MSTSCRIVIALGLLAWLPCTGHAQTAKKGDKVRITTIDGVELNATFYACTDPKIKSPPVVLMLHPLGDFNSSKKNWVGLAETLQKQAAVLTFDFRGHGQSTDVDPEKFWKTNFNKQFIKGANVNKMTIEFKEFDKQYYPALVNDIAACKSYLDRINDKGACNTSSFIVVGADTGATLGAIWLASEWHRHRLIQNPAFLNLVPDTRAEGMDIIGCVWLSIGSQLGNRPVQLSSVLEIPLKQRATPMVFMYGDGDDKGKSLATKLLSFRTQKEKAKYQFTDKVEIKNCNLRGMELLQKSLGTNDAIATYLEGVIDAKGREWTEREFRKTQYVWRVGNNVLIPARELNGTNLNFDTYTKFIK